MPKGRPLVPCKSEAHYQNYRQQKLHNWLLKHYRYSQEGGFEWYDCIQEMCKKPRCWGEEEALNHLRIHHPNYFVGGSNAH